MFYASMVGGMGFASMDFQIHASMGDVQASLCVLVMRVWNFKFHASMKLHASMICMRLWCFVRVPGLARFRSMRVSQGKCHASMNVSSSCEYAKMHASFTLEKSCEYAKSRACEYV